jgi:hypothetical protein
MRIYIAAVLVVLNGILLTWLLLMPYGSADRVAEAQSSAFNEGMLQDVLRNLFYRHDIAAGWIHERTIRPGIRREMRVWVPVEHSTAVLNFEIHRTLRSLGFEVHAREDSQTKALSIHIRHRGVIIQTVIIQPRSDLF